jgi:hypothetical protein
VPKNFRGIRALRTLRAGRGAASLAIEQLETRLLLSTVGDPSSAAANVVVAYPTYRLYQRAGVTPSGSSGPVGYTPSQLRQAYGFNQISFSNGTLVGDGTGQTIAIIDAYDDPNIAQDLATFDTANGLPAPPSFTKVNETGGSSLPSAAPANTWGLEISLDVEWAHALAPGANILLVETNSASTGDMMEAAVGYARTVPGVSVITMSFGVPESDLGSSSETSLNSYFTTPTGHQGITFVASTGDSGAPGEYPAYAPTVLAVGGTTLSIDGSGNYISESGWSDSGGGISQYISQPSFQSGVVTQSTTQRTIPDVAFDADPNSGVGVCDSYDYGASSPWIQVGGTSLSAPSWAALTAVIDQGRVAAGMATLNGGSDTLPRLYALPSSDFHDITTGSNGFAAGPGYDLVTGLGSPLANLIAAALVSAPAPTPGTPSLMPATDSGVSNTDGITNFNNSSPAKALEFSVPDTVIGDTVDIYAGSVLIGSTVATSSSTVVTTNGADALADGVQTITARQAGAAGVLSAASAALSITIDTTPPTVTAQSPASATSVAAPVSSLQLTFSEAMDNTSFTLAGGITSFTGPSGNLVSSLTGYSWSTGNTILTITFTAQSVPGSYQLILAGTVRDVAGNTASSAYTASFTVVATAYSWNMNSNPGWTLNAGSLWAWGTPSGSNGTPSSGYTGSDVVGFNLNDVNSSRTTTTYYATTPALNLTNYENVSVGLWYYLNESRSSVLATVQVLTGSTWTTLATGTNIRDTGWVYQQYQLPSSVNGTSGVEVRFGIGPTGSSWSGTTVWYLDDVTVFGTPLGTISGETFIDANGNGTFDAGEQPLSGVTVYVDLNNSGSYVAGDPSAVSTSNGSYTINSVPSGQYTLREVAPSGYIGTNSQSGAPSVSMAVGGTIAGENLGSFPTVFNTSATTSANSFSVGLNAGKVAITETLGAASPASFTIASGLLPFLTIVGGTGGNTLTVDFTNGDPVPASGLNFTGGAGGGNTLILHGAPGAAAIGINATQITLGSQTITYANVQALRANADLGATGTPPNLTIANAALWLDAGQTLGTLTLNTGGTARFSPNGDLLLAAGALTLGGGTLDLANNHLLVHNESLAAVQAALASGYNNGAWNGTGIITSYAASNPGHGLGYLAGAVFAALHPGTLFFGAAVAATDVVVRYTWVGDTTLRGSVTATDYAQIDTGYLLHLSGWLSGDFNYDGVVDAKDYALIDNAYSLQGGVNGAALIAQHTAQFGAAYSAALAALQTPVVVPSPTPPTPSLPAPLPPPSSDDPSDPGDGPAPGWMNHGRGLAHANWRGLTLRAAAAAK